MIEIIKGKLLKGDIVEIDYTRKTKDGKPTDVSEKHKDAPHPDLKQAFNDLAIHAAIIGEFVDADSAFLYPDQPVLKKFNVTGFSLSGEDENEAVVLTANRELSNKKILIFNTPLTKLNDNSEHAYTFEEDLRTCILKAKVELKKYMEGKYADEAQLTLDLPEKAPETNGKKTKKVRQTAENPSGLVEE